MIEPINEVKKWFCLAFADLNIQDPIEVNNFISEWQTANPYDQNSSGYYLVNLMDNIKNMEEYQSEQKPYRLDYEMDNMLKTYIHLVEPLQEELKTIIRDFDEAREKNELQKQSDVKFIMLFEDESIRQLFREKISSINYIIEMQPIPNGAVEIIKPNLVTFENALYYNLMQYIMLHNNVILRCKLCKKIITNPTKMQMENVRRGNAALHELCRDDYRFLRDRLRKRTNKWRDEI